MFQAQMKSLETIESALQASPDKQLSQTDPDARSMQHRGGGIVGYNVQAAVDTNTISSWHMRLPQLGMIGRN